MKMFYKIAAVALVMVGFSATANAQTASDNANATATIISPIEIANVTELWFGEIIANAAGSISVGTNDDIVEVTGVQSHESATIQSATFTITGTDGLAYTVVLPGNEEVSLTLDGGTDTMDLTEFEHNSAGVIGAGLTTETFGVGAKLNVAAGQAAGVYTGTFTVEVSYN
ncbi:DUF4402 domain-containing protein [Litoribacter populi]|uniref:DUF4402 domain-containing protein n=1 Tax=Litoribacter populi TaxID=2598460 RepID=UPI00117E5554|nr:DUF4402 domain-containing protein [Litoribacter populi]